MFVDKNCAYGIVKGGVLHRNKTENNENNINLTHLRDWGCCRKQHQLKNTP